MAERPLPIGELALELERGETYLHAVKRAMEAEGIAWPQGRCRLSVVSAWLEKHPHFRVRAVYYSMRRAEELR